MVKVSDKESKVTPRKRDIKITDIKIEDGKLVDEEGSIIERLADALPYDDMLFSMKISFELPDEDDSEDEEIDDEE